MWALVILTDEDDIYHVSMHGAKEDAETKLWKLLMDSIREEIRGCDEYMQEEKEKWEGYLNNQPPLSIMEEWWFWCDEGDNHMVFIVEMTEGKRGYEYTQKGDDE